MTPMGTRRFSPYSMMAPKLLSLGYSILPLTPASKTIGHMDGSGHWKMMPWKEYQSRLPLEKEVANWSKMPLAGIGLVCGSVSNIIAIDIDVELGKSNLVSMALMILPSTPCIKRGSKGETRFYRYNNEVNIDFKRLGEKIAEIQLLSDGKFTVLPPSIHPSTGKPYQWTGEHSLDVLEHGDLPIIPPEAIDAIRGLYGMEKPKPVVQSSNPPMVKHEFEVVDDLLYSANDLLQVINPDIGYGDWITIGMALHHKHGDAGLPIWDAWSRGGTKYAGFDNLARHFQSFRDDKSNPVTYGSLVHLAKRCGFDASDTPIKIEVKEIIKGKHVYVPLDAPIELDETVPIPDSLGLVRSRPRIVKIDRRIYNNAVPAKLLEGAPGVLGEITRYINATALYPSAHLSFAAALSIVSTCKAHRIASPDGTLRTNFMCVSVALSGRGKDHPRIMSKRILGQLGLDQSVLPDRIASGQGIVQMLRTASGKGVWLCDEFGRLYSRTKNLQSSTASMSDFLIELYNAAGSHYKGSSYADNSRSAKTDIDQPCLNIHATTVPDRFYESIDPEDITDGFFARWLIFDLDEVELPLPSIPTIDPNSNVPPTIRRELEWWLSQPTNCQQSKNSLPNIINPRRADYHILASDILTDFQLKCRQKANDLLQEKSNAYPIYNRTAEMAIKLAIVACNKYEVTPDVMQWACDLSLAITKSMLVIIKSNIGISETLKIRTQLVNWFEDNYLKDKFKDGFSANELFRLAPFSFRNLRLRDRKDILDDLINCGQLRTQTLRHKGNGTTFTIYWFTPDVPADF